MRYHLMLFICLSLCDGFVSISNVEENEKSACEENPCKNGGSCIEANEEDFSCTCTAGYIGNNCEFELCSIKECLENEICVLENGEPECKIIAKDPCKSKPCKHGGSCTVNSDIPEGFSCSCADGYVGEKCETDQCGLLQCHENEVCVVENRDVKCKINELCSIEKCLENEICVLENGKPECKILEKDPCKSKPCKNGGSCTVNSDIPEGYSCSCADRYVGEKCEIDQCGLIHCHENEVCVVENRYVTCKIDGESNDTTEDLATTTPNKVTSTTTITTHKEKNNKTTTSGNTVKATTVTETSNTDKMPSSSSTVTRSITTLTKATTKITKSTKNEVETTTRVSLTDQFSRSVEITSETNPDDHHKYFTVTNSSPSVGNTTAFDNNTIKTSHTLTDGLTTVAYTTNTKNFFKSSSQSSPKLSSQSSTPMSTSASTSDANSGYTSEKPQITISTSAAQKEKTATIDFKSTGTYASTTETLKNTSASNDDPENDINRTNESSQTVTTYASLGAVCFAALVAFAAGGWYIRRRSRRRKRECYTECDTSSEISRNSDSIYTFP